MSYRYSNQDYLNMALCYNEANNICTRACDLYFERYGRRINPRTILGAVQRHRETGSFRPRPDAGRPRYPVRLEEEVLDFFIRHPVASSTDATHVFSVSKSYVLKVLHSEGFYPYHILRVQELLPHDFEDRVEFSQWLCRNRNNNIGTKTINLH